jgi:hypothetical protein
MRFWASLGLAYEDLPGDNPPASGRPTGPAKGYRVLTGGGTGSYHLFNNAAGRVPAAAMSRREKSLLGLMLS